MIPRELSKPIKEHLEKSSKAIVLYGARQVGKTTLVKQILAELDYKTLSVNADDFRQQEVLSSRNTKKLLEFVEGYQLLFIDEAQRIKDIGLNLKILIDNKPELKIIATGSSSFELAQGVSEPLTGRKWTFTLYPISQLECRKLKNNFELNQELESRLIFGSYPEIFTLSSDGYRKSYLIELSNDYLYQDILKLVDIRNPDKLRKLLQLLAFQIGSEVSLSELGGQLEMSKDTVARYLDLLEKNFVITSLRGFSRNLRKEVSKSSKYYFLDLGVRNILIDNLKPLEQRNDLGQLWENFLIVERLKRNAYKFERNSSYFWRTYTGAEIDYLEESGAELHAYEIKYKKKARAPKTFLKEYSNADWQLINQENWLSFVL